MAKVTMPQLGESVAEGTIGRWLKQPGDTVAKYEPLLEVITDKVNAEVPSPYAGVLKEILAEEGAVVPNNAEIAVIETEDEALAGGTDAAAAGRPREGRRRRAGRQDDRRAREGRGRDAAGLEGHRAGPRPRGLRRARRRLRRERRRLGRRQRPRRPERHGPIRPGSRRGDGRDGRARRPRPERPR